MCIRDRQNTVGVHRSCNTSLVPEFPVDPLFSYCCATFRGTNCVASGTFNILSYMVMFSDGTEWHTCMMKQLVPMGRMSNMYGTTPVMLIVSTVRVLVVNNTKLFPCCTRPPPCRFPFCVHVPAVKELPDLFHHRGNIAHVVPCYISHEIPTSTVEPKMVMMLMRLRAARYLRVLSTCVGCLMVDCWCTW